MEANDDDDNDAVDRVLVDVLEDVKAIVDDASVEDVEDRHHDEDVEHVRHLSGGSPLGIVNGILRVSVKILRHSGAHIRGVIAPEINRGLREEVLAAEADCIHDGD